MPRALALTLSLILAACAADRGASRAPVVYGADDRLEVYEHPSAVHRAIAEDAVAVMVHEGWIDDADPDDVRLTYTETLGEAKTLCEGERFADQIEPGVCSGTLVDDRHILTAAHCVDEADDCAEYAWVLGFRYARAGVLATLDADDVYRCESIVASVNEGGVDHAFVRLDRPVAGHAPVEVRRERSALTDGTPLVLIGHPNGIPMKIAGGGAVTWSSADASWLNGTVDAFSGNSGSGVFDEAGRLVAVLTAGADDYVDAGGCNVVNVIDPPDDGETLTYAGPAIDALCALEPAAPRCACDPPCARPPGETCAEAEVLSPVTQSLTATLGGYADDGAGRCGGDGPERVYAFTLDERTHLNARTGGFDTLLYLRAGCEGAELACNDDVDVDTDRGSRLERTLDPGTYALFVDAYGGDVGTFTLALTFTPSPLPDAGSASVDAGPITRDAGPIDAGPVGPSSDGGAPTAVAGGCHVHHGSGRPALIALALALCAILRRRRQPRGPRTAGGPRNA